MSTDKMRSEFEALLQSKSLDNTQSQDAWDQWIYKETHIQAMWEGYQAALSQSEPAQESQEPIAVMWQHEETGNTGFVDMSQVENRFFKHNPRLKQVCFCYSSSPDYEALHELFQTAVVDFHAMKAENKALKLRVAELEKEIANHVEDNRILSKDLLNNRLGVLGGY